MDWLTSTPAQVLNKNVLTMRAAGGNKHGLVDNRQLVRLVEYRLSDMKGWAGLKGNTNSLIHTLFI